MTRNLLRIHRKIVIPALKLTAHAVTEDGPPIDGQIKNAFPWPIFLDQRLRFLLSTMHGPGNILYLLNNSVIKEILRYLTNYTTCKVI